MRALNGRVIPGFYGSRAGAEMSDIGVAEIPVDEDERPLPPPKPPARNALLDGPILPTLASLAWPNIMAFSAGTCVVIAETSYIGRLDRACAGRRR
jgi:hypothetical protein